MITSWAQAMFNPWGASCDKRLSDGTARSYVVQTPTGFCEHHEYRFNNGYGASIIRGGYSYGGPEGLWELAVMIWDPRDKDVWSVTYETPVTDDVLGCLTEIGVSLALRAIRRLPPREGFDPPSSEDESHETHRKVPPITAEDIEALRRSYS